MLNKVEYKLKTPENIQNESEQKFMNDRLETLRRELKKAYMSGDTGDIPKIKAINKEIKEIQQKNKCQKNNC